MIAKVHSTKISKRWDSCSCGEVKEHRHSYPDGSVLYIINNGKSTYIGKSHTIRQRIQVHSKNWPDYSNVHLFYLTEKNSNKLEALEQNIITYCFENKIWNLRNSPRRHKNYHKTGDYCYSKNRSTPYYNLPEEYKSPITRIINYVNNYFIEEQREFESFKLYKQQEFIFKQESRFPWATELLLP